MYSLPTKWPATGKNVTSSNWSSTLCPGRKGYWFPDAKKDHCEIKPSEPADYRTGRIVARLARCHLNKASGEAELGVPGDLPLILDKQPLLCSPQPGEALPPQAIPWDKVGQPCQQERELLTSSGQKEATRRTDAASLGIYMQIEPRQVPLTRNDPPPNVSRKRGLRSTPLSQGWGKPVRSTLLE